MNISSTRKFRKKLNLGLAAGPVDHVVVPPGHPVLEPGLLRFELEIGARRDDISIPEAPPGLLHRDVAEAGVRPRVRQVHISGDVAVRARAVHATWFSGAEVAPAEDR